MAGKLDELIKNVNKEQKEEVMTRGLTTYKQFTCIPFTSPRMNYCTFGGIPEGRLVEFYGEEGGGKTTSALDIVANFQAIHPDRDVLYIDAENTLDVAWATKLGVDVDKLYILQPKAQSAEEIFDIICDAVESGEVGLWVLDSIGALLSSQEFEKSMDEKTYGGISLALTRFSKRIDLLNHKHNCTGIGINQERDDMNSQWGGTRTVGGRAWKFMCTMRLKFGKGKFIDEKGNELTRSAETPAGNIVMMSITKTKACPPTRRTGFYTLNYELGIDYLRDLIDVAVKYSIIDKHGAWYTILDPESGEVLEDKLQGASAVYDKLDKDSELLHRVEDLVDKAMGIGTD